MKTSITIESIKESACASRNQHLLKSPNNSKIRSKYGNNKKEVDGILFDSKKEAKRYCELKLLLKAGEIELLERQVRFLLIGANESERKCEYLADFCYIITKSGEYVVEDVKGIQTDVFKIKRKLMKEVHNIEIKIV